MVFKNNIFLLGGLIFFIITVMASSMPKPKAESNIKVMTYNIWNGFDWGKDSIRHNNFIKWINSKKPDVLALQELCGYDEDKLKADASLWGHNFVKILKKEGYPVGITSNKPIKLKQIAIKPFWHGLLHCETYGIDFFIVHLSPFDAKFRIKEAKMISQAIQNNESDKYIILGDFNAFSPMDAHIIQKNQKMKNRFKNSTNKTYSNLIEGQFDYSAISQFIATPAIDLIIGRVDIAQSYTYPTQIFLKANNPDIKSLENKRVRIDYILASPYLAKYCKSIEVFNQRETHRLSDHYPLMAEFHLH